MVIFERIKKLHFGGVLCHEINPEAFEIVKAFRG